MIRICKKKQCKTGLATNWKKSSSDESAFEEVKYEKEIAAEK